MATIFWKQRTVASVFFTEAMISLVVGMQTYYAASIIKNNKGAFDALVEALSRQAPVEECVATIEAAVK